MAGREPKYVVADRAVNRRTAKPALRQPEVAPTVRKRVLASAAKNRLGAPLSEQLRRPATRRTAPVRRRVIAGAMVGTAGAMVVLVGAFQGLLWLAGSGLAAAAAGAGLAWAGRGRDEVLTDAPSAPLFDPQDVNRLDAAMDTLAAELPSEASQALAALKATLVRIARHPAAARPDEHFTLEDRMYVVECVRRYLPDSLEAYLRVPAEQRALSVAGQPSADDLLLSQLQKLAAGLKQREERMALSATEGLQRQERFLRAKE